MPILQEPEISLEGARVRGVSATSVDFDVTIRVRNKNPVGVTMNEMPFIICIGQCGKAQEIANGNTGKITIRANEDTVVTVPVSSKSEALVLLLSEFLSRGELRVTIRGTAVVDAIVTHWAVPFEKAVVVTPSGVREEKLSEDK